MTAGSTGQVVRLCCKENFSWAEGDFRLVGEHYFHTTISMEIEWNKEVMKGLNVHVQQYNCKQRARELSWGRCMLRGCRGGYLVTLKL